MKLEKVLDIIDTKLHEASSLFPETLGTGHDEELAKQCTEFRTSLILAQISLEKISQINRKKVD